MKKCLSFTLMVSALLFLSSCGTTDATLASQGHSADYIQGFHDGRHSGMKEEGNQFEHYLRDEERFKADTNYKQGWVDGEREGKKLQDQATTIGNAAGGVYTGVQVNKEVKKSTDYEHIAKDAVKGVDTTGLDKL